MMKAIVLVVLVALLAPVASDEDCASLSYCSNHGQCREGRCVCHDGWGYDDCSMSTSGCPTHCYGHGQCLNGTCDCFSGYTGSNCEFVAESCPRNCSGHGMCNMGKCICFPGFWTGDACDVEIYRCPSRLNNCTGHGECGPIDWENETSAWACSCHDGFEGEACDKVVGVCPNNCTGHGICKDSACECQSGFAGADCSQVQSIDACPHNCSGQGLCKQTNGSNTFSCQCFDCYQGPDCSQTTAFCPGNCSSRGLCQCDGTCACRAGYTGDACQNILETCENLNFCSGNGACLNGTCKCQPGFAGAQCSLACHTGGGNNTVGCWAHKKRGKCIEQGGEPVCACIPEYEGVGCQQATSTDLLEEYYKGWNPIGTVMLCMVGACLLLFVGGFAFNYTKGKRGVNAVPGIAGMRSKVRDDTDYEAMQGPSQRDVSNY